MKAVILAGGMGTRLSEETIMKPKPMVEIGERPILWHIMKIYATFGVTEFIICCGYKGNMIKEYFINYDIYSADTAFRLGSYSNERDISKIEPWKVTLVNTGHRTLTAGRIMKIKQYLENEPFFLTYGDGVANLDIAQLLSTHRKSGKTLTISTTRPEGRFGIVDFDETSGEVQGFQEKVRQSQGWVNIGFMVMEPEVFNYLENEDEMLEEEPFSRLLGDKQINAYTHEGFWSPMDTIRDKQYLEKLWNSGNAPWKIW